MMHTVSDFPARYVVDFPARYVVVRSAPNAICPVTVRKQTTDAHQNLSSSPAVISPLASAPIRNFRYITHGSPPLSC